MILLLLASEALAPSLKPARYVTYSFCSAAWLPLLLEQRPIWECKQQGKLEGDRKKSDSLSFTLGPIFSNLPSSRLFFYHYHHQSPASPGSNSTCSWFFSGFVDLCGSAGKFPENKLPVIVKTLHCVDLKYSLWQINHVKVWHFGKYSYSLSSWTLDKNTLTKKHIIYSVQKTEG